MRIRSTVLTAVMIVSAAACGGDGDPAPSTAAPRAATAVPTTAVPMTEPPATTTLPPTTTSPPATTAAPEVTLGVPVATTGQEGCPPATPGKLHDASRVRRGPYFIYHPAEQRPDTPTVMFIPGGSTGSRRAAQRVFENYLSAGTASGDFRLVIPYAEDFDLIDDTDRLLAIVPEVLACHGGDPESFHVAGYSQGGQIAFGLMLAEPDLFATVLGAPGEFRVNDPDRFRERLGGKAVFNGVGAEDEEWIPSVQATHDALVEAGIESLYVEFPAEGHRLSPEFDETIFFSFWLEHSSPMDSDR